MKKVALVTCYFQPNYGSMLQAYATQQILDEWDIPNETICIEGLLPEIHKAKIAYFKSRIFSPDVIKDKWGYLKLVVAKRMNKKLALNMSLRDKAFHSFSKKMFRISQCYSSKSLITIKANDYSAFLVGSDQLWLPSNIAADYYTLNFVPDKVRKIAYATSFGVSYLPPNIGEAARKFLPRIHYLSVREKSGQKLVKTLIGEDVPVVCDPTLLLTAEEWMGIQKKERYVEEPYIFCYYLGDNPYPREFANELKTRTGLKIVALQQLDAYIKSDEDFADEAPYNVDPSDFVNLIRYAEYVCTDSFHGTVFSILNHRTFFSFRRFITQTTMSTNSRIDSLLEVLELSTRLQENDSSIDNALQVMINYEAVDERLTVFRRESQQFLKLALMGLE
ncbi:polysaccharide pyruvyl transferase family protein [Clostridium sp. WB02_MRS01]|uniref:polysaccharide pyruvyl transferase family protein n=1 Tax=Clostridium sp. WB02_MRS01 TaxID=2605777 RepID=UPI001327557D|nr:polysaccharide pyruvyl transferase family protein [Clostridium sp. WB02_MRS01]